MLRPLRVAGGLAATLLALAPAAATTVLDVPIDELARGAGVVVRGVVERQEVTRSADGLNIETRTSVRVTQLLKGQAGPAIVIRQTGGVLGKVAQRVPGDATFVPGEQVLVLLEPHSQGEFVLVAMAAAKFSIVSNPGGWVAIRELGGLTFAKRGPDGRVRIVPGPPTAELPLTSLLELVARGAAAP